MQKKTDYVRTVYDKLKVPITSYPEKLRKAKIVYNSESVISADGKVLITFCKTPEGSYLELVQEL